VINKSYGSGNYIQIGAYSKQGLVGGYCALIRNRLGVQTAVTPLLTPYTGFFTMAGEGTKSSEALTLESEILASIAKYVRRYRYQNLQFAPGVTDFRSLVDAGYILNPRATLEINLRLPENELWESFQGNVRRNIKKAQKVGFDITDQWDTRRGFEIFAGTFARHGQSCPVPETLVNEIADGGVLYDYRQRYCAWLDGKLQAYLVALNYNGRVYYELAATDADALSTGVSSLLVWEMLRDHLGKEWDVFDFVGANTRSISRFKECFNPTLRTHLQGELCASRRIGVGRGIQRLLRKRK
jgi:lipid II:glycine glycyltransferase (peptidoglycan interpeptide bridge formation enzyme)